MKYPVYLQVSEPRSTSFSFLQSQGFCQIGRLRLLQQSLRLRLFQVGLLGDFPNLEMK